MTIINKIEQLFNAAGNNINTNNSTEAQKESSIFSNTNTNDLNDDINNFSIGDLFSINENEMPEESEVIKKISKKFKDEFLTNDIFKRSKKGIYSNDEAIQDVKNGNSEYKVTTTTDEDGNKIEEREYENGVKYTKKTDGQGNSEIYILNPETGNYEKVSENSRNYITREIGNEKTGDYENEYYNTSFYGEKGVRHTKGNKNTGDYETETELSYGYSTQKGNEKTGDYEYKFTGNDGTEEYERYDSKTGDYEYSDKDEKGNVIHKKKNEKTGFEEYDYKGANGEILYYIKDKEAGYTERHEKHDGNEIKEIDNKATGEYEYYESSPYGELHIKGNAKTGDFEGSETEQDGTVTTKKWNNKTGEYEVHEKDPNGTVYDRSGNSNTGEYTLTITYPDGRVEEIEGNANNETK